MSFTGFMNCKSPFSSKNGESDDELGISLAHYVVEVPEEDRKAIRTILLTSGKIVSLSLLLIKTKIKKRNTEPAAAVGKRILTYLVEKHLGEKRQYYIKRNKSNVSI